MLLGPRQERVKATLVNWGKNMQTLKMKIVGYEEASHSLLVSFASDETASQDPIDYPALAYQPVNMWPDVTDVNEIKKRIAVSGMHQAEMQARQEAFVADEVRVSALKALVGQVAEFSVDDLLPPAPSNPEIIVQTV